MKANKAPEKIYLSAVDLEEIGYLLEESNDSKDVEYIRTDAFIEKACEWLKNNLQGIVGGSIYIDDFRKYMEGE